jgi:hypothetical protein
VPSIDKAVAALLLRQPSDGPAATKTIGLFNTGQGEMP